MSNDDRIFDPVTVVETVVYCADGTVADRLPGRVAVSPKDYEALLPVEVRIVETTTRLLSVMKIEKR